MDQLFNLDLLYVFRDAMIISVADTFTSALAGVTIFAILGNLARTLDVDISKVVDAGNKNSPSTSNYSLTNSINFYCNSCRSRLGI